MSYGKGENFSQSAIDPYGYIWDFVSSVEIRLGVILLLLFCRFLSVIILLNKFTTFFGVVLNGFLCACICV